MRKTLPTSSLARMMDALARLQSVSKHKLERYMTGVDFRATAIQVEDTCIEIARRCILPRLWNFPGTEKVPPVKIDPSQMHLELSRDIVMLAAVLDSPIYIVSGFLPPAAAAPTKDSSNNSVQHHTGYAVDIFIPDDDPLIVSTIIYQMLLDRHFMVVNRVLCGYGMYHLGVGPDMSLDIIMDSTCFQASREVYARHGALGPIMFKIQR